MTGPPAAGLRVMLADDSVLFRRGVRSLLESAGAEVVADVDTGQELVTRVLGADPDTRDLDAVLLDIRMRPTFTDEGLQAALTLGAVRPTLGVLLLSTYAETEVATRLLDAGTSNRGYLLKDRVGDVTALLDALRRVARGEPVLDPYLVSQLLTGRSRARDLDDLTDRERAVLELMAEGRSNAGIGRLLFMSPKTVEAHAASIFGKLGLDADPSNNKRVLAVLAWLRARPQALGR